MNTKEEIGKIEDFVEEAIERGELVADTNLVDWLFATARVGLSENPKSLERFVEIKLSRKI